MSIIPTSGAFFFVDVPPQGKKPNENKDTISKQFRVIAYSTVYAGKVKDIPVTPYREVWSVKGDDKFFATGKEGTMLQYGARPTSSTTKDAMPPPFPTIGPIDLTFTIDSTAYGKATGAKVGTAQATKITPTLSSQVFNVYRVAEADGFIYTLPGYGDFYVLYIATPGSAPSK